MRKAIIFFGFLLLTLGAAAQNDEQPSDKPQDTIYIPVDLEDCFHQLDLLLSDSVINQIREMEEAVFCVQAHFGLGLWIRNNWGLWGGGRLYQYFKNMGLFHPDDMSSVILSSYHKHLNNKPLNLEEKIAYYRDYWKETLKKDKKKRTKEKREAYRQAQKSAHFLAKKGITPINNWDSVYAQLGLPIRDEVTHACTKVWAIGDTLSRDEIEYVQYNQTRQYVYHEWRDDILGLWDWNDLWPFAGPLKHISAANYGDDMASRLEVEFNVSHQVLTSRHTDAKRRIKCSHEYDTLGRKSHIFTYHNDTLATVRLFTYAPDFTITEYLFKNDDYQLFIKTNDTISLAEQIHRYTLGKDGNIIKEERIKHEDTSNTNFQYEVAYHQYDHKGRHVCSQYYSHNSLVFFNVDIYDDSRNLNFNYHSNDLQYDYCGWISLLDKHGREKSFASMDYPEKLTEFEEIYRIDRHGNVKRMIWKEEDGRTVDSKAKYRYW
ncbi:MAG: hypothetical protein MJZ70_05950 [Bacteroidales bacterium]|nr:hypothetical protein [Bacteroidales bacterium]